MRYYRDLKFGFFDHLPQCSIWIDRDFPEFYALNYAHSGKVSMKTGEEGEEAFVLNAPVAWSTWPGPRFQYGCSPAESWDHYFVTFSGERVQRYYAEGLLVESSGELPCTLIGKPDEFRNRWLELFRLLRMKGEENHAQAVHCLEGMLLVLRRPAEVAMEERYKFELDSLMSQIKN